MESVNDTRWRVHFHWTLLWVVLALLGIGVVNLHSATYSLTQGGYSSLLISQLVWIAVGAALSLIFVLIDYRVWGVGAYPFYFSSILLLLSVVFFGKTISGNRNWLALGPLTLQPSEFAKVALVLVLARYFSEHPTASGYHVRDLIRPFGFLALPLVLILLGKDVGSALFFVLTFLSMLLFAGVHRKTLIVLGLLAMMGGAATYHFGLSPYQRQRIFAFLQPSADPQGRGYHVLQSKIAVGSGGWWGKGYLKGMHNKLKYVPERHTDFVFPVLAEEWGFAGSIVVVFLYVALLSVGLQIAAKARDRFGLFLALGVTALLFWQVAINLGGVLGLLPLTGVTLPFLSYGGSSMVSLLIAVGFLLNVEMRRFVF